MAIRGEEVLDEQFKIHSGHKAEFEGDLAGIQNTRVGGGWVIAESSSLHVWRGGSSHESHASRGDARNRDVAKERVE